MMFAEMPILGNIVFWVGMWAIVAGILWLFSTEAMQTYVAVTFVLLIVLVGGSVAFAILRIGSSLVMKGLGVPLDLY
jgi:hypothetical protein